MPIRTKLLRFGLTGILATGVHVATAVALIEGMAARPALANAAAFIVATLVSFVINTVWSFSKPVHGRTLVRFLCVAVLGCLLTMMISELAQNFGLHYLQGILIVVIVVPAATFLLHNLWTYGPE